MNRKASAGCVTACAITGRVRPPWRASAQHLGVNAGFGVMAVAPYAFGLRAEIRYFQDLVGTSQPSGTGIDFGSFHFWRASIGAVVAF